MHSGSENTFISPVSITHAFHLCPLLQVMQVIIKSLTHLSIHPPIRSLVHQPTPLSTHPLAHHSTIPSTQTLTGSPPHPSIHSLIHWLTNTPIHPLTHWLTNIPFHPLIYSLAQQPTIPSAQPFSGSTTHNTIRPTILRLNNPQYHPPNHSPAEKFHLSIHPASH